MLFLGHKESLQCGGGADIIECRRCGKNLECLRIYGYEWGPDSYPCGYGKWEHYYKNKSEE